MSRVDPGACTEPELTGAVNLCTPDGRLNPHAVGWSRRPFHRCALPGSWGRRKRWDYWCIATPSHVLSLTYADVDYLGLADVWFLDTASGRTVSRSAVTPLGRAFALPDRVAGRSMFFERGSLRLEVTETAAATRLRTVSDRGGRALECDVMLARPEGHEPMSV